MLYAYYIGVTRCKIYKAPQQLSRLRKGVSFRGSRKGNVIKMKQKRSRAAKQNTAKPSVRKVGTMLGSGAICVLTVGMISVIGLLGNNDAKDLGKGKRAANVNTAETEREECAYTALDTVTWRKASINEYEIAEVSAKEKKNASDAEEKTSGTETTTSATEKKTETEKEEKKDAEVSKAEAESSAETKKAENKINKIAKTSLYVESAVNLRSEPSKSAAVIEVIDADEEVVVDGCTVDGIWYSVKHGNSKGYALTEYFTGKSPESKTASDKGEGKKNDDNVVIEIKDDKGTHNGTIKYTDEEYEMLCYVLQGEVGDCSEASKIAVANVIINRVKSSQFPNSISGVLTAPSQFDAVYGYYNGSTVPTQNTRDCAARALAGEDNTGGAIYYYAPQYCGGSSSSWFESLQFCLEVDGQRYFKNW